MALVVNSFMEGPYKDLTVVDFDPTGGGKTPRERVTTVAESSWERVHAGKLHLITAWLNVHALPDGSGGPTLLPPTTAKRPAAPAELAGLLTFEQCQDGNRRFIYIELLAVAPSFSRHGVGSLLIGFLERCPCFEGHLLLLHTHTINTRAREFYEFRCGFVPPGQFVSEFLRQRYPSRQHYAAYQKLITRRGAVYVPLASPRGPDITNVLASTVPSQEVIKSVNGGRLQSNHSALPVLFPAAHAAVAARIGSSTPMIRESCAADVCQEKVQTISSPMPCGSPPPPPSENNDKVSLHFLLHEQPQCPAAPAECCLCVCVCVWLSLATDRSCVFYFALGPPPFASDIGIRKALKGTYL